MTNSASIIGFPSTHPVPIHGSPIVKGNTRLYAISFELDNESLKIHYNSPFEAYAYDEIKEALKKYRFTPQTGNLYFGEATVDAVSCVLAVQSLAKKFPWFAASVRDVKMLRIEEVTDLYPALNE